MCFSFSSDCLLSYDTLGDLQLVVPSESFTEIKTPSLVNELASSRM